MGTLSEEEQKKIRKILEEKNAVSACPRCGNRNFTMAGGYFVHPIQSELKGKSLGGPAIPTIGVICTNCGFISQHALGTLGLLEQTEGGDSGE